MHIINFGSPITVKRQFRLDVQIVFKQLLPQSSKVTDNGGTVHGLGMHWIRHRKPGTKANSNNPDDLLFSQQTVGHGSFSGCILVIDLEQQMVIVQVRRKFGEEDSQWWNRFFQVIAEAIDDEAK